MKNQDGGGRLSAELGKVIAERRSQAGYSSQEVFAKAVRDLTGCPMSRQIMGKIENGQQMPSLIQYLAICMVLGYYPLPGVPIGNALMNSSEKLGLMMRLHYAKDRAAQIREDLEWMIRFRVEEGEKIPKYMLDFVIPYDNGDLNSLQKLESALERYDTAQYGVNFRAKVKRIGLSQSQLHELGRRLPSEKRDYLEQAILEAGYTSPFESSTAEGGEQ